MDTMINNGDHSAASNKNWLPRNRSVWRWRGGREERQMTERARATENKQQTVRLTYSIDTVYRLVDERLYLFASCSCLWAVGRCVCVQSRVIVSVCDLLIVLCGSSTSHPAHNAELRRKTQRKKNGPNNARKGTNTFLSFTVYMRREPSDTNRVIVVVVRHYGWQGRI